MNEDRYWRWVRWEHRICLVALLTMCAGSLLSLMHGLFLRWVPGWPGVLSRVLYLIGAGFAVSLSVAEILQLRRLRRRLGPQPGPWPGARQDASAGAGASSPAAGADPNLQV